MSIFFIHSELSLNVTPLFYLQSYAHIQRLPARLIDPLLTHVHKAQLYHATSQSRHSR